MGTIQLRDRGTFKARRSNATIDSLVHDDLWRNDDATKVLVVDAQRLSGELLATILIDREMEVVGVCTAAADAIRETKTHLPDLAIIDLEHPEGAVALGSRLLDIQPRLTLLALSAGDDQRLAGEAIRAGFHGCVTRDVSLPRFFGAVSSALNGDLVVSHRLAGTQSPDGKRAHVLADGLTPREREVLGLLVAGTSSEDMARKLSISANTVRTHVSSILSKLQVHSRLEAVTFATRHRLVQPAVVQL